MSVALNNIPNNYISSYQESSQLFDLISVDIAQEADIIPVTCQDARKYISWMKLESNLATTAADLSDYINIFSSPIPSPGGLLSLNAKIKTDIKELDQTLAEMIQDPFITFPEIKSFLNIVNQILGPIRYDIDNQGLGGFLPVGEVNALLEIVEIVYFVVGEVLQEIPSVIEALDKDIQASEVAINQYLDVNAVGYDQASMQTALVNALQAMRSAANGILIITESGAIGYSLLTAVSNAPAKVLSDIQNQVDPSADLAQLLIKLEILDKKLEQDFLKGNFLDDLINDCYVEVAGKYFELVEVYQ